MHSTPVFYVETQIGRKPWNALSYMSWSITFIGSTNFLCFPAATRRRLQPPSFSSYNLREVPTPQFFGYNTLCSPATTRRWLQPHALAPSNCPKVEVEWWNHCQPITVVQLYQPVPLTSIQYVQPPCNQSVPELNMYLQKVQHICDL